MTVLKNDKSANDFEHSEVAGDVESAFSPNCPGWPPAEPKQHELPFPCIGVPWGAVRDSEDGN